MFEALSIASAATVFVALGYLAFRMPALLVKPSTLFLGFFCLQVQISAAINSKAIIESLVNPWVFFSLVHAFPLVCLAIVFLFQRHAAERLYARIGETVATLQVRKVVMGVVLLFIADYAIVAVYISHVPLSKTGLYAAMFEPEMYDSYRQLSMTLLENRVLAYLFTIQEKVLGPITGAACALLIGLAWRAGRHLLALAALVGVLLAIFPAMLSGARGPGAMVVMAALFAWFVAFARRLTVGRLLLALLLVLSPPIVIMLAKSQTLDPRAVVFQTLNALDRAIGRGYVDNVWHLRRVAEYGPHGVGAIEKLAVIFNVKPIDAFRDIATSHKGQGTSFGLGVLGTMAPSVVGGSGRAIGEASICDPQLNPDCVDVAKSGSAGASFVVMNYAIFGWPGLALSIVFVFMMDLLLWLYKRMDDVMLVPAIAASVVPTLALSFSLFTTVLASKGLLLIPLTCLGLGWVIAKALPSAASRC